MMLDNMNDNGPDELSLKDLIWKIYNWGEYLFSKRIIIVAVAIIGGVIGFTYAYLKKPIYTATTTFVLEDEKSGSGLGNIAGLASIAGVDLGGSGGGIFQGDNILELYKSRKMIAKTLLTEVNLEKKQLLVDKYVEFNKLREKWSKDPLLSSLNFSREDTTSFGSEIKRSRVKDSVLAEIVVDITKNYLVVGKVDEKLSIIMVDVKAKDELFAKAFNEAIVKNVNDFYLQTKTKKSLQNVRIMQHKTDSVRSVMNGAIYSAVAVADATPNLNPTRQVQRVAPVQKAQFSAETNKTILGALVQNLEMSKVSLLKETPLLEVIDQPILPLKKNKPGLVIFTLGMSLVAAFLISILLLVRRFFVKIVKRDE